MNKRMVLPLIVVLGLLALAAGIALAQGTPTINWWLLDGGGAPSGGGNVAVNDSLGQPIIGPSSGGGTWLGAGFWGGAVEEGPPPPPIPVGGYIVPISKLKLLLPWMGLATLAGLLLAGMAVALRRHVG
jgi:hypothetical protein